MCGQDLTNLQHKRVCACAQPETILQHQFSKIKTKQDDGDVFWWIFSYVNLLKLEKYVEDENR